MNYWEGLPLDPQIAEELRFGDKAELLVDQIVDQQPVIYRYSSWDIITHQFKYVEVVKDLSCSLVWSPLYQFLCQSNGARFYRIIPVKSRIAQLA